MKRVQNILTNSLSVALFSSQPPLYIYYYHECLVGGTFYHECLAGGTFVLKLKLDRKKSDNRIKCFKEKRLSDEKAYVKEADYGN